MKSLFVCLLLALAGQSFAQTENEFIEYLLEIQSQAEEVHDRLESIFNDIRFQMSEQLVELNQQLIGRMNSALEEVQDIRDNTEAFVGESSAPASCVDVVVANWGVEINLVGEALSRCASRANLEITARTADVHAALEEAQIESTELQNIVVRGFIDWNAIDFTEELADVINSQVENRLDYFNRITQPALDRVLQGVSDLDDNLLPEIMSCVERGVERFNNYGQVIRDTLSFCSQ
ncbi:AGAP009691-PA-like protein [Anopheles sinensis]|uniref:AGAP009691-PA-like protein n=1 Tax=Anopheles sinensis TaxID=74873 RepID=A0A084VBQ5_ANOSI|nr:AGAP009691-PA-like protein [Anopheles sinensis]